MREDHLISPAVLAKTYAAIDADDPETLNRLIPLLPDGPNCVPGEGGFSLLYNAAKNGSLKVCKLLLASGALVESMTGDEYTPLFIAVQERHLEVVELLLSRSANITGEFNFNAETALSMSAWHFCNSIFDGTSEVNKFIFSMWGRPGLDLLKEYVAFRSVSMSVSTGWIEIAKSEKWLLEVPFSALRLIKNYLEGYQVLFPGKELDRIALIKKQMRCYALLLSQYKMAKGEIPPICPAVGELSYKLTVLSEPSAVRLRMTQRQMTRFLEGLHRRRSAGNVINWETEPRLFVPQFRGIHYFNHHFDPYQREGHAAACHLNRLEVAPAAGHRAGATIVGQAVSRETVRNEARDCAVAVFDEFESSGPVSRSGRRFPTAAAAVYQYESNDYAGFRRAVESGSTPEAERLKLERLIGYPHYAASDMPTHALRYAFGLKQVRTLSEHRLSPGYGFYNNDFRRPRNRYLGKVFITLSTPDQLRSHKARSVVEMHNRKDVDIRKTVIPEREFCFPGGAPSEVLFYEHLITLPDFSQAYSDPKNQQTKLTQEEFRSFTRRFARLRSVSVSDRASTLKALEGELMQCLCSRMEEYVFDLAAEEAKRREGYLVFRHSDTEYKLELPGYRREAGSPLVSRRDQELVGRVMAAQFPREVPAPCAAALPGRLFNTKKREGESAGSGASAVESVLEDGVGSESQRKCRRK